MSLICTVVGARPNFMKMAPVILEARRRKLPQLFVHTGQHYDTMMSGIFAEELGLPEPDLYLGVGSGSHAAQTARVMLAFEEVCVRYRPALVIVGGDVNSTLGCALAAAKAHVPVAHVEAGLRSFDRDMPEEVNRVLTDHVSDLLFTSERSGNDNLLSEGIAPEKVLFVGNCMIDSLRAHLPGALAREPWRRYGLEPDSYALLTLHRPATVDDPVALTSFRRALQQIAGQIPVLFPAHPRTRRHMERAGDDWTPVRAIETLGYMDFLGLMAKARLVLTDSGGIQEETTVLDVPCLTLRDNTERPVTVVMGTNRLVGTNPAAAVMAAFEALAHRTHRAGIPELWDGQAARRVIDAVECWLKARDGAASWHCA